ncbi:prepilin-type N-terminal cleavage/methylation domain-containing protein [Methylophilus sp. 3sh_L]|uniref:prepilin-type N-terminal cleavage/methylation domain-containing protein n=1 Tax=Methylophilus sp. 3sh_L TaxID=3377114 RepID=UPI00398E6C01
MCKCLIVSKGFSLIEVMVVLIIIGVVASGAVISFESIQKRDAERTLRRLKLVLEACADRAIVNGRPIALELLPNGYRFSALDADDTWRPLEDPPVFTEKQLSTGLYWAGLSIEGRLDQSLNRLQFGTQPTEYVLRVTTSTGEVRFIGKATGNVEVSILGSPS